MVIDIEREGWYWENERLCGWMRTDGRPEARGREDKVALFERRRRQMRWRVRVASVPECAVLGKA
jgi:hypothetical protein